MEIRHFSFICCLFLASLYSASTGIHTDPVKSDLGQYSSHLRIPDVLTQWVNGGGGGNGNLPPWAEGLLKFSPAASGPAAMAPGGGSRFPLALAVERTRMPDVLDRFRMYRGGWDITNKHYWAEMNKKLPLPRDVCSVRQLELVPVITTTIPVDPSCQYREGYFPCFKGLADSVTVMNGINAPKVVECFGSDGLKYRQLAKSGNDDLRQDAVKKKKTTCLPTTLRRSLRRSL